MHIRRPIRAGLLYGVDNAELLSLIAHLLIPDFPGAENKSFQQREERARLFIAVVSGYTAPELADNCFWGDAIVCTKKRPPKRKRNDQGVNDHQYFSSFPSPSTTYSSSFFYTGANGEDDGDIVADQELKNFQRPRPTTSSMLIVKQIWSQKPQANQT